MTGAGALQILGNRLGGDFGLGVADVFEPQWRAGQHALTRGFAPQWRAGTNPRRMECRHVPSAVRTMPQWRAVPGWGPSRTAPAMEGGLTVRRYLLCLAAMEGGD